EGGVDDSDADCSVGTTSASAAISVVKKRMRGMDVTRDRVGETVQAMESGILGIWGDSTASIVIHHHPDDPREPDVVDDQAGGAEDGRDRGANQQDEVSDGRGDDVVALASRTAARSVLHVI